MTPHKKWDYAPRYLYGDAQGVSWNGYFLAGSQAYKGKNLDVVDPLPFPAPPADKGDWRIDAILTTPDTLYIRQGYFLYRFKTGDKELKLILNTELFERGGNILAVSSKGDLLGIRGQGYFVMKPGDKAVQLKPIPAKCSPTAIIP